MIWRREAVDGSEDWTSVHAFNVDGFRNEVVEGAMVQIFPLADGLPIIELKIINATRREDMGKPSYHLELEEITDKSYWTFKGPPERRAEFPTDLLVLYPPIKQASLMSNKTLLQEDLPENIKSDIIKSALDFDGDGKADAIVCYFCCRDRSPIDNCDYHCNETYVKINNNWVMTNSSQPM